jgi:hypothetical protein
MPGIISSFTAVDFNPLYHTDTFTKSCGRHTVSAASKVLEIAFLASGTNEIDDPLKKEKHFFF